MIIVRPGGSCSGSARISASSGRATRSTSTATSSTARTTTSTSPRSSRSCSRPRTARAATPRSTSRPRSPGRRCAAAMAVLHVHEWGEPTGAAGRLRPRRHRSRRPLPAARRAACRQRASSPSTSAATGVRRGRRRGRVETHLDDLLETADALGIERGRPGSGTASAGGSWPSSPRVSPDRVERAVLLDPAMHIEPAGRDGARGAAARRVCRSSPPDEAIDARLADADAVLDAARDDRAGGGASTSSGARTAATAGATRPPAVIAAWSEMATPAPPWPDCPTLVVLGAQSWIPNRVPRLPHLTSTSRARRPHRPLGRPGRRRPTAVAAFLDRLRSDALGRDEPVVRRQREELDVVGLGGDPLEERAGVVVARRPSFAISSSVIRRTSVLGRRGRAGATARSASARSRRWPRPPSGC